LLTALKNRDQGRRDEVLIPGYTCYSVAAAVVKAGLKIRLYDLDQQTLNPDIQSIEASFNKHTLVVVSQHLFGIPVDLIAIGGIAAELGAYHIEDAAQAFRVKNLGETFGTKGDFGLFSFGRGKPLPLGGGGALVSSKYDLNDLVPSFKINTNWKPIVVSLLTQLAANPAVYGLAEMLPIGLGETVFDPEFAIGAISAFQTNLFVPMMPSFQELNRHRRFIASIYQQNIPPRQLVTVPENKTPIYPRFPVLAKNGNLPVELQRLGVRRLYPNALHKEPQIVRYIVNSDQKFPGAESLARNLITLPTHHNITEKLAEIIGHKVNRWINKSR
jgi:dTDP-4-amino-4,6-dideoxygalactose transaminase